MRKILKNNLKYLLFICVFCFTITTFAARYNYGCASSCLQYGSGYGLPNGSDNVKFIQGLLGVKQDGFFGADTRAKLVEWQRKNGELPDGILGDATSDKLKQVFSATPDGQQKVDQLKRDIFGQEGSGEKVIENIKKIAGTPKEPDAQPPNDVQPEPPAPPIATTPAPDIQKSSAQDIPTPQTEQRFPLEQEYEIAQGQDYAAGLIPKSDLPVTGQDFLNVMKNNIMNLPDTIKNIWYGDKPAETKPAEILSKDNPVDKNQTTQRSPDEVVNDIQKIDDQMKKLDPNSPEYKALNNQLGEKMDELQKSMEQALAPKPPEEEKTATPEQGMEAKSVTKYECFTLDGKTWIQGSGNAIEADSLVKGGGNAVIDAPLGTPVPAPGKKEVEKDNIGAPVKKQMATRCAFVKDKGYIPDPGNTKIFNNNYTQNLNINWK